MPELLPVPGLWKVPEKVDVPGEATDLIAPMDVDVSFSLSPTGLQKPLFRQGAHGAAGKPLVHQPYALPEARSRTPNCVC